MPPPLVAAGLHSPFDGLLKPKERLGAALFRLRRVERSQDAGASSPSHRGQVARLAVEESFREPGEGNCLDGVDRHAQGGSRVNSVARQQLSQAGE